jgi:hypothetical protein
MDKKNGGRKKERRRKERRLEAKPHFAPKKDRRIILRRECDIDVSCYD